MFPTLLSAAGNITAKEDLSKGAKVGDTTIKARIDGYHLLPSFKGAESPQHEFLYWTDDGGFAALRYNQSKITFLKPDAHSLEVCREPFVDLLALRSWPTCGVIPFKRGNYEGIDYGRWFIDHAFMSTSAVRA